MKFYDKTKRFEMPEWLPVVSLYVQDSIFLVAQHPQIVSFLIYIYTHNQPLNISAKNGI